MSQNKRDKRDERNETDGRYERGSQPMISIRRGAATLLAVVLVATTALATVALTRLTSRGGGVNQPGAPAAVAAEPVGMKAGKFSAPEAGVKAAQRDELQLQIGVNGFTPSEATHAPGVFAIAVENVGVEGEYVLQLKNQGGTTLREVRVQKGSTSWTVDMVAGSYTLVEANHPNWVCNITVQ